jgi:O-succinylbenzoate synthase
MGYPNWFSMLQNIFLYEYVLDFKKPQIVNNKLLNQRIGLILSCGDQKFLSEASPLPGYSQEKLEDVIDEVKDFDNSKLSCSHFPKLLSQYPYSNATKFALFSLFLQKKAQKKICSKPQERSYIDIPSFHDNWFQEILNKIDGCLKNETNYVKIKMSSYTVLESIEILKIIKKRYRNSIQLHLDFNQKLSLCEASAVLEQFKNEDFFLIEDPVKRLEDLEELTNKYTFKLALDQTLRDYSWKNLKYLKNLSCVMIKPTLSMDLLLEPNFLAFIKKNSLNLDLSSSYESPIGIDCIKKLGFYLFERFTLGIDTLSLFKQSSLNFSQLKKL